MHFLVLPRLSVCHGLCRVDDWDEEIRTESERFWGCPAVSWGTVRSFSGLTVGVAVGG
jgi:hypothetical protein